MGILPMTIVTLAISGLLWGGLVYLISGRSARYLRVMLLGLPLSAAGNILIKGPLALGVAGAFGLAPIFNRWQPIWFLAFLFLLSPVVEEALKPLPLVLRSFRSIISDPSSALSVGMGLGIGFGLGEAAYIAYGVAQAPEYLGLPWYLFTGYLYERTLVCFIHGVMTAAVVMGYQSRRLLLGYLAAVGLHALVNSGAVLLALGMVSALETFLLLIASTVLCGAIFIWLRRRSRSPGPEVP